MNTIDANGHRTTTIYDANSRPAVVIDANGCRTTYTYDNNGNAIGVRDGNGHLFTTLYDKAGRKSVEIDPLGRRITYAYDPSSNLVLKIDPRGVRVTMNYDARNQLVLERYPDSVRHTYTYDPAGNRITHANPAGITSMAYNGRNQPTIVAVSDTGGTRRTTYTYDPAGRRRTMIEPSGGTYTYTHDLRGRLTAIANPQNKVTTMAYDGVGNTIRKHHGNGLLTTMTYDSRNNLTGIINTRDGGTGSLVSRHTHTYDNVGNRLSQVDQSGVRTTWTYDNINQLEREQRSSGGGASGFDISYDYDCAGNRIRQSDTGAGEVVTLMYDNANQLETSQSSVHGVTTYTHDAAGNVTQKDDGVNVSYYTYDDRGQMALAEVPAGVVTMTYNALGQRIQKISTDSTETNYLYDGKKLLQESDDNGDATHTYTSTGGSGGEYGDLISEYDNIEDETSFGTFDAQWSAEAWIDESQAITDQYKYKAFGLISEATPAPAPIADDGPRYFGGQQNYYADLELNLYLLGMGGGAKEPGISGAGGGRYYDPAIGRFLAQDPIGFNAGDPNLYRYVGNNPVNANDPSGQEPWYHRGPTNAEMSQRF